MSNIITLKDELIKQIINRLKKFGFVHVNKKNIATDEVYSQYLLKILNGMLGEDQHVDLAIEQLLNDLKLNSNQQDNKR